MKMRILALAFILMSGIMTSKTQATLRCGGILVSCGTAAGCWDDEMTLEEYTELVLDVDSYACP